MKYYLSFNSLGPSVKYYIQATRHISVTSRKVKQNEDYEVLHTSSLPTMHFQKSLLRLPIPDLEKTCERYLRAQKAILNDIEYKDAESTILDFKSSGIGEKLQNILKANDKANKHTSYISQPWFDMYLSDRASVVLNYNPFLMFLPETRAGYDDPVIRATNILISSMRFMKTMKLGILEPEVYHLNAAKSDTKLFRRLAGLAPSSLASYVGYALKAFPLDMSQFKNLFHSTRIPVKGKDVIREFPEAKHMMVMKNGNIYTFDLLDDHGNLQPPATIHACMDYIHRDRTPAPEFPVPILTSENRDVWAEARQELVAAGNEEVLSVVDSSAFNIVFDSAQVGDDPEKCYRAFLYGDGNNRWFDKSFSLIFAEDGATALNFEHAWGDGVAVMRYFNEVVQDVDRNPFINPDSQPLSSVDPSKLVRRLEFKLTEKLKNAISAAQKTYTQRTDALGVNVFESDIFGKDFCKKKKVSPDAMMQLGFQLAYYLQNGSTVATYESCSTSAFRHGRTETLRPATLETTAFCRAVTDTARNASNSDLKAAIYECSERHGLLTKEAAMGQGFDRHLFGLRKLAEGTGDAPALFRSETYAKMNHNVLSTSTLPSSYIAFGGFAPVVPDGFGVGYQIQDGKLGIVLSSYPPSRNGSEFIECAEKAYKTIHDVLSR